MLRLYVWVCKIKACYESWVGFCEFVRVVISNEVVVVNGSYVVACADVVVNHSVSIVHLGVHTGCYVVRFVLRT